MCKTILLGATFALVSLSAHGADLAASLAPVPVKVTPGFSGYVEMRGNAMDFYGGEWSGLGGAAAVAYRLDDTWQVEADLDGQRLGADADDYSQSSGTAALHLNYYGRAFAIGAFAGVTAMTEYWNAGILYGATAGIEGQINLADNFVMDGQAGYLGSVSGHYQDSYPLGVAFAQADMKFFPTDNVKLQATVGVARGDSWTADDVSLVTWGVEGEYQFDGSPVSVFAAYSQTADGYYDKDSATAKLGARFSFGGDSLKEQARTGASHKVMDFSPIESIRWY